MASRICSIYETPRKLNVEAIRICSKLLERKWVLTTAYQATYENESTGERNTTGKQLDFVLPAVTLENFNERVSQLAEYLINFSIKVTETVGEYFRTLSLKFAPAESPEDWFDCIIIELTPKC